MACSRDAKRAVSPIIGTVLIVGMVVILSAAIGAYVVGFGEQQPTSSPQVAIVADYSKQTSPNGEYLNLSFESGDSLDRSALSITVRDAKSSDGSDVTLDSTPIQTQAPTTVSAGVEISINANHFTVPSGEHLDLSDAHLRLLWRPADVESETYVIYRWPAPSKR